MPGVIDLSRISAISLYPLQLQPILHAKVWGGRSLARWHKPLPTDSAELIGESWELADLPTTSADGAGGHSAESVIVNGPLAGRTLHELIQSHRQQLLGTLADETRFPLLIKYLDAQANLSVQIHPRPHYAAQHPQAHLKSEAWYILHTEPNAQLYLGLRPGTTHAQLKEAIAEQRVIDLLQTVPARTGDCHYLPSGLCHALGAGIVVAEVQTPSDTTYRLYDWGRTDRTIHVEQALDAIDLTLQAISTPCPQPTDTPTSSEHLCCACEYFEMRHRYVATPTSYSIPRSTSPTIWMILSGAGHLTWTDQHGQSCAVDLVKGQTFLLPADQPDELTVHIDDQLQWLAVTLPQADERIIA